MNRLPSLFAAAVLLAVVSLRSPVAAAPADVGGGNAALQYYQAFVLLPESIDKVIDEWNTVPLEGEALTFLGDVNPRFDFMHAGAQMERCDWGIDFTPGPATLMPHVNEAHRLARTALLRARYRFEQGRGQSAVEDVLGTMELARDVGVTPVLICLLVQYRMDDMAGELTARHLGRLDRRALDLLAARLAKLPADDGLRQVWKHESEYFVDWAIARVGEIERQAAGDRAEWERGVLAMPLFLKEDADKLRAIGVPSPEKFRALLNSIKTYLAQMEAVTDLPPAQQDARLAELAKPFKDDAVSELLVPAQGKVFSTRRRWQARRAMLAAAVAVAREGPDALKQARHADPFGDGAPFTYHKTGDGFELASKLTVEGKPVNLVIGMAKK